MKSPEMLNLILTDFLLNCLCLYGGDNDSALENRFENYSLTEMTVRQIDEISALRPNTALNWPVSAVLKGLWIMKL